MSVANLCEWKSVKVSDIRRLVYGGSPVSLLSRARPAPGGICAFLGLRSHPKINLSSPSSPSRAAPSNAHLQKSFKALTQNAPETTPAARPSGLTPRGGCLPVSLFGAACRWSRNGSHGNSPKGIGALLQCRVKGQSSYRSREELALHSPVATLEQWYFFTRNPNQPEGSY